MLIDTHCHLDAAEFEPDRADQVDLARAAGVSTIVIPAVNLDNLATVRALAARLPGCCYALGIHPLCAGQAPPDAIERLRSAILDAIDDPRFVAIGEIGLDYFVPGVDRERQQQIYEGQLRLARDMDLPVLLHVRRSQDKILQGLRRFQVRQGIAHAFNGSFQQAEGFLKLGFAMGFGGAMTFSRALQIRRLAAQLPEEALVLETDSPDIAPQWIDHQRNSPAQLARIAEVLAELRNLPAQAIAERTRVNALRVLPRLAAWLADETTNPTPPS